MCGRYTIIDVKDLYQRFGVNEVQTELSPSYNAAPGQTLPVITKHSPTQVELMRWGFIPHWAKDPRIGMRMINARMETLQEKPSFRKPLIHQRCVVPANGFYEWGKNGKQPYYFQPAKGGLVGFAGLYDVWNDAEGREIKSFTIITKAANDMVKPVHERMPVILAKDQEAEWLDAVQHDANVLMHMLETAGVQITCYPVSKAVNLVSTNEKALIKPLKINSLDPGSPL